MSWIFLLVAGALEISWPLGLKIAQTDSYRIWGFVMAGIGITLSGLFLFLAQKQIPIGTAYAIWTGIGAAGTFAVGVLIFGDAGNFIRYLGVMLIICGVITLKLTH